MTNFKEKKRYKEEKNNYRKKFNFMSKFRVEWINLPKGVKVDPITVIGNENKDNPNINIDFEDAHYSTFGLLHKMVSLDPTKIPGGIYYETEETE